VASTAAGESTVAVIWGLTANQLSLPARILALACAFEESIRDTADMPGTLAALRASESFDSACLSALAAELGMPADQDVRARWPADLTDREVEVLRLVAAGNTTRQSAQELIISEHTARHHLESIYSKIGVSSRAGAVLFAVENGLLAYPFRRMVSRMVWEATRQVCRSHFADRKGHYAARLHLRLYLAVVLVFSDVLNAAS
jgi:DNA-binding CsgD family transcriptional regulator